MKTHIYILFIVATFLVNALNAQTAKYTMHQVDGNLEVRLVPDANTSSCFLGGNVALLAPVGATVGTPTGIVGAWTVPVSGATFMGVDIYQYNSVSTAPLSSFVAGEPIPLFSVPINCAEVGDFRLLIQQNQTTGADGPLGTPPITSPDQDIYNLGVQHSISIAAGPDCDNPTGTQFNGITGCVSLDPVCVIADVGDCVEDTGVVEFTISTGNTGATYTGTINGASASGGVGTFTVDSGVAEEDAGPYEYTVTSTCLTYTETLIIDIVCALPVELLAFNATPNRNSIALDWATASERNNSGFEIQRSTNPRTNFEKIGWIDGAGNSASRVTYDFLDGDVRTGVEYYYQLKQIDSDGAFELSDVVSAKLNDGGFDASVTPNPAKQAVEILISGELREGLTVTLLDIQGRIVSTRNYDNTNTVGLNISDLPAGMYMVQIQSGAKAVVKKLIVE